jgi:Flp pilus assembly protein TadG
MEKLFTQIFHMNSKDKKSRNEKGAELVETSFVILLFVFLILGVFNFGRAYNIYQNITTAAREGARFAVAPTRGGTSNYPTEDEVKAVINGYLQSVNLDPSSATVTITNSQTVDSSCNCGVVGCPCGTNVALSYPITILWFDPINISTTSTMRIE